MRVDSLLLMVCIGISACSSPSLEQASSTRVQLAGETYVIAQLTAGTWTASAASAKTINGTATGKAALIAAIEKTSGCKVTDSDYSRNGMQLDAQVDCGSRLKN